jgi:hypothetical protein
MRTTGMPHLAYLEGKKLCVVFVKLVGEKQSRVQMQCFRGRADIAEGRLNVVAENGMIFTVPSSAHGQIMPSDGTVILKDAEYFVLVKADPDIQFFTPGGG